MFFIFFFFYQSARHGIGRTLLAFKALLRLNPLQAYFLACWKFLFLVVCDFLFFSARRPSVRYFFQHQTAGNLEVFFRRDRLHQANLFLLRETPVVYSPDWISLLPSLSMGMEAYPPYLPPPSDNTNSRLRIPGSPPYDERFLPPDTLSRSFFFVVCPPRNYFPHDLLVFFLCYF